MVIDIQHSERRSPTPNNRPGHLHVDGVHQGDQDGLVDEVDFSGG